MLYGVRGVVINETHACVFIMEFVTGWYMRLLCVVLCAVHILCSSHDNTPSGVYQVFPNNFFCLS